MDSDTSSQLFVRLALHSLTRTRGILPDAAAASCRTSRNRSKSQYTTSPYRSRIAIRGADSLLGLERLPDLTRWVPLCWARETGTRDLPAQSVRVEQSLLTKYFSRTRWSCELAHSLRCFPGTRQLPNEPKYCTPIRYISKDSWMPDAEHGFRMSRKTVQRCSFFERVACFSGGLME